MGAVDSKSITYGGKATLGGVLVADDGTRFRMVQANQCKPGQRIWTSYVEGSDVKRSTTPENRAEFERYARVYDTSGCSEDLLGFVLDEDACADQKIKTAAKKAPLNLLPLRALKGASRVFQYGGKKYKVGNFLKATLADGAGDRYAGADLRHLSDMQELDGTFSLERLAKRDDESGLPEIDHILATVVMLRAILTKEGLLPEDPGEGNEPPGM